MNNKTFSGIQSLSRKSQILVLTVVGLVSIAMFSFAYTASAATLSRQLDLGMTGSDVSDLQIFLATDSSIYPQGLVTGYYGQLTKAAVERFQSRNGIVSSGTPATTGYGRVGPSTIAAINARMGTTGPVGNNTLPTIGQVSLSVTNTGANVSWNTTKNTSAIVYYSTFPITFVEGSATSGVTISGSSALVNTDLTSSHTVNLAGLQPNTAYYYSVYVRDAVGTEDVTLPATFTTQQ